MFDEKIHYIIKFAWIFYIMFYELENIILCKQRFYHTFICFKSSYDKRKFSNFETQNGKSKWITFSECLIRCIGLCRICHQRTFWNWVSGVEIARLYVPVLNYCENKCFMSILTNKTQLKWNGRHKNSFNRQTFLSTWPDWCAVIHSQELAIVKTDNFVIEWNNSLPFG